MVHSSKESKVWKCHAVVVFLSLSAASASLSAQPQTSLRIAVSVRPAILLSLTDASGARLSQGGISEAFVLMAVTPSVTGQDFQFMTRALVTSSPSPAHRLFAKLATGISGTAVLDGAQLSQNKEVLVGELPYLQDISHTLQLSDAGPVSIVLTCRPQ
jgi:hypothetical protein